MKALVTGGCGFLGAAVVRELKYRSYNITVLDKAVTYCSPGVEYITGDTQNIMCVRDAIGEVDEIYHFAGALGTTELLYNSLEAVETNIAGTINVLEAAKDSERRPRILFASMPAVWMNIYSITKGAAAEICRAYKRYHGMDVRVLRFLNAYGPEQHLIPIRKVAPIFIIQALRNLTLEIWGTGEQLVDLVYCDDAAYAAVEFMDAQNLDNKYYDTGIHATISVNDLAKRIIAMTSSKSKIIHLPMREGEDTDIGVSYLDTFATRSGNPLRKTSIEAGLDNTISYFRELPEDSIASAIAFYYGDDFNGSSLTQQAMRSLFILQDGNG